MKLYLKNSVQIIEALLPLEKLASWRKMNLCRQFKHLLKKYCPFDDNVIQKEIDRELKLLCMVEIEIDHLTGKQAIDFVRKDKLFLLFFRIFFTRAIR